MTKTATHKQVLDELYDLVVKEAQQQPPADQAPAAATTKEASAPRPRSEEADIAPPSEAVSAKHDTTDQNAVRPETSEPQCGEQKPAIKVPASAAGEVPTAARVIKAPVDKLGQELLDLVNKLANSPAGDVASQSISNAHDTVNQNAVRPENLTQNSRQAGGADSSIGIPGGNKTASAQEQADYELGRQWAQQVIKSAQEREAQMLKEAGSRDLDRMIAQVAQQLKQANTTKIQVKQAADKDLATLVAAIRQKVAQEYQATVLAAQLGAQRADEAVKQAQFEQAVRLVAEENAANRAKLAELATQFQAQQQAAAALTEQLRQKEAALATKLAEEKEDQRFAALASHLGQHLVERLTREAGSR